MRLNLNETPIQGILCANGIVDLRATGAPDEIVIDPAWLPFVNRSNYIVVSVPMSGAHRRKPPKIVVTVPYGTKWLVNGALR